MKRYILSAITLLLLVACVRNDIPYPKVVPVIISVDVDGGTALIDNDKRTVTVVLDETYNPKKVKILSVKVDKENVTFSEDPVGVHNLSEPKSFILSTYQDYKWTFSCKWDVERYFTVDGQIGASVIDVASKRIIAYVRKSVDLSKVKVTSMKLGPKGLTTYSHDITQISNFCDENGNPTPFELAVSYFDVNEYWTIFVEQSDISINVKSVNPWTKEAYITAVGVAGMDNGFKFRVKDEGSDWSTVSSSDIVSDGGEFTAHLKSLNPDTQYEFYAYSGSDMTEVQSFRTDPATQLPNNSFEVFSVVTGSKPESQMDDLNKGYYKWYDPASEFEDCREIFWASGNGEGPDGVNGTGSLGIVLTYPDADEKVDGEYSVRCETKNFVGLLACGNIFLGRFAKLVGTSGGAVNYGRPWATRPKALRVWIKYNSGKVDIIKGIPPGDNVAIGDNDRCEVAVSVGDWDYRKMGGVPESPVYVNTSDGIYYTSESEGIIGFGHLVLGESTDGWQQVEIPLDYRSLDRRPTHIIITCASSYLGDYLTGSSQSKLWVDKMELIY